MSEEPNAGLVVNTPVAKPAPRRRLMLRRVFLLGGFWSGIFLGIVGLFGAPLDFMWPRKLSAFGGPYIVPASEIPPAGGDPVRFPVGRFYLANLEAGQEGSPGGVLALYQKCTHLGCTVPWRPDFEFNNTKGWYRCPCHGSTYTREGGIIVAGLPNLSNPPAGATGPLPLATVYTFHLNFGHDREWANALNKITQALKKANWGGAFEWYVLVNGAEHPTYYLVLPRTNWAGFAPPPKPFPVVLEEAVGRTEAESVMRTLDKALHCERSELIRLRPDLSYTPPPPAR